ncbi:FlgK family flagellar hook-associated protein, partial [Acinetobacter guillouiae]|uniref:FlgK family flagellar hook-associated protein n=1 Tax=Acinetobacter guillouiae TaxID=106649 RepID=UPI0026E17CC3
ISVFMGDGIALVAKKRLSQIEAKSNGYSDGEIELYIRGQDLSERISGGKIGGTLEYRNDVLNFSKNSLGQIALGLT